MEVNADPLYKLRHSLAHVLAQAVLQIRPGSKLAFGPPIDTGCYYDFLFTEPLTSDDFSDLEKRMRKIINERQEFIRSELPAIDAISHLKKNQQGFKVEYCEELKAAGETTIGFYTNGPFEDMCAGPHVKHTGEIPPDCFKIDSIAGAYWRGSEKNPQLTRIYCLAFSNKAELGDYLKRRELARERDHRKLGKELELFIFDEDVGPGLALWTPHGTVIRDELEKFAKEMEARGGYVRVATPHLAKEALFYTSGHLPYYKDTMFPPMIVEGEANYYLKAMNCPHHHCIYRHRPRSYRELPLRLAEYGTLYRFEPSGTLSGLSRVRCLTMNDAHIYCTPDQMKGELIATSNLHFEYYRKFRFDGIKVRLSMHDPQNKDKFIDSPELWEHSESVLRQVAEELKIQYSIGLGEAAFYGPKIDFQAQTVLGKEESIGTTQLDFHQPVAFKLTYVAEDGKEHTPCLVHRAPLSTHERFVAFLIEHFAGAFPTWLAPVQVRIIPVGNDFADYAAKIQSMLQTDFTRTEIDQSSTSFNKKIREAVTHKIPNIVIVGAKEKEQSTVTLRRYAVKEQVTLPLDKFVEYVQKLKSQRVMDNFADVNPLD